MDTNPCMVSPEELVSSANNQNDNNAVSSLSTSSSDVPSVEQLRKIELDVHPLVDFEHLQRFSDLETNKSNDGIELTSSPALAARACLQQTKRSFVDAASAHENDPECLEPIPDAKEIDDINLSSKLKEMNEKYHQMILSHEKELLLEGQEPIYIVGIEHHGLVDYIGYCVQNPITQQIWVVQYYYMVPDETKYSYPLDEKQVKYGFHYEPTTNSHGELEYTIKGIHYLGARINPYSTNYVMCLRPPSVHKTVMTFLAKPNEWWTLFFAHPPQRMIQQNDVKIKVEIANFPGTTTFNIETKHDASFTELAPKEFIPLPHNATLCQIEVDTTVEQVTQVVAVTQEWVWTQRYLSKLGRVRKPKNIIKNPQISQQEREFFLKHDFIRYSFRDPIFEEWLYEGNLILDKKRKYTSDELVEFGVKVLHWVSESIPYTAKEKYRGCGEGGVAFCAKPAIRQTDCGGKALMIAAAMRYNNIPARVMQGQFSHHDPTFFQDRLANMTLQEARMGFHAMIEYWIDELGWVPVEGTDWRGFTFGRDRNKTMFVRHFDFIPKLQFRSNNQWQTEEPYFVSAFFPVLQQSKEPLDDHEKERQDYMVYVDL